MKITSLALMLLTLGSAFAEEYPTVPRSTGDKTITKVVKLLQEMLDKSKTEGDEEKTIYAKFKCYCDKSEAEKNKAVADNTKLISLLESEIEELQGSNGELSSKCADLKASKAANKQQRSEAKTIRDKEHKKFIADTTDFEQAIRQMEQAIQTLTEVGADQTKSTGADNKQFMAGHKGASLLSLQASMQTALSAAESFMDQKQYQSVTSFIQAPFTGTYTSQSGAVMGIIKNMRDTFKANLAAAVAAEESQLKSYNAYMEVKTEAYNVMSEEYDAAQEDLGDNDETLSTKRTQLDQAEKEKANDEEFLGKLLPMCKAKGESYQERKLLRANEEVAIAQAISILDSDEAFATFGGVSATSTAQAGNLQFLQVVSKHFPGVSDEDVREVMQRLLRRAAGGRKAPRLAAVISTLQAQNPFDSVLDEIE
jgi:chromosome segregation ATPase